MTLGSRLIGRRDSLHAVPEACGGANVAASVSAVITAVVCTVLDDAFCTKYVGIDGLLSIGTLVSLSI